MAVLSRSWLFGETRSKRDDCGYVAQRERIADYDARHISESVLPFNRHTAEDGCHPDGCSWCGKSTWWESRLLPNGQRQTRCTECHDTVTWD